MVLRSIHTSRPCPPILLRSLLLVLVVINCLNLKLRSILELLSLRDVTRLLRRVTTLLLPSLHLSKVIIAEILGSLDTLLLILLRPTLILDLLHITSCLHLLLPLNFVVLRLHMEWIILTKVLLLVPNLSLRPFHWPISLSLRHLLVIAVIRDRYIDWLLLFFFSKTIHLLKVSSLHLWIVLYNRLLLRFNHLGQYLLFHLSTGLLLSLFTRVHLLFGFLHYSAHCWFYLDHWSDLNRTMVTLPCFNNLSSR
jgi:hypothetical protein